MLQLKDPTPGGPQCGDQVHLHTLGSSGSNVGPGAADKGGGKK